MWTTAGGIAVTFDGLIVAVIVWLVGKLRGHDLFDQVMRQAEADQAASGPVSPVD